MKTVFIFLFLLLCSSSFGQEPATPHIQSDTTVLTAGEITDSLNTGLLLLQLQKQMSELQMKMDQIQSAVAPSKSEPVEVIPAKKKNSSHFYGGMQFAFFFTSDQYSVSQESKQPLGTYLSYALKPSVGYVFSPRWNAGLKFVYADCSFSGLTSSDIAYLLANAFIGGGISLYDYVTWSVQPYARCRITRLFWERVNLWAEVSGYAGQKIPRDSKTRELQKWDTSTVYGMAIRPMITCDLNRNLMIFTCMEFLSWNGSTRVDGATTGYNNSLNFQFVPIYSLLSGLFNIGLLKKF